ncbi:MAG: FAD-dependent oxidoreductase [Campylobacterota bacterium]|nr:FAD-dependent oxidoreductase [Campylobacterota bacterium]
MKRPYDSIVIGAGIAGASVAYFLRQKGQKVLVMDKKGVAKGGSGAAGAFVSPKIGKGSPLQQLTNEAFTYAKDFYLQNFPECYHQTGVVRIPKDELDAEKFTSYEEFNTNKYEKISSELLSKKGVHTPFESFYFEEAGVCDAAAVCEALLSGIECLELNVSEITYEAGLWQAGGYLSSNIVLATGYENNLFDMRYMGVRGTWGTRGDFATGIQLDVSMHQSMSVSSSFDGVIKLGATHEKLVKDPVECRDEQALGLQKRAKELVDTSDFKLLETFCGMRAGSKDYFPLLGSVVDVPYMLKKYPKITQGSKIKEPIKKISNLYVCNGLGGRGFVFGPLMGKMMAESIIDGEEIDSRVDADRLFLKWCRRVLAR